MPMVDGGGGGGIRPVAAVVPVGDAADQSPDGCLASARRLLPVALDRACKTGCFHGRWQVIIAKLDRVPACLSDLSTHPLFAKNALCLEQLQSICRTLAETVELADRCVDEDLPRRQGKLQMQSDLDAVIGKLELNLRDCALLLKTGVLTETAGPIRVSPEDDGSGVRELLARLQIGHLEAKHRALDGLLQLIRDEEKHVVAALGRSSVAAIVQLLSAGQPRVREKAVAAVCVLVEHGGGCEKLLLLEGALAPLLKVAETGSSAAREKAVVLIQRLCAGAEIAQSVAGGGGISTLIGICRTGDSVCQTAATGALRNLSAVPEIRQNLADEGAVAVVIELLTSTAASVEAKEYAAEFLQNLTASNTSLRHTVVKEGAIASLLTYLDHPLPQEAAATALRNVVTVLSYDELLGLDVFPRLIHVLRCGSLGAQQAAASAVCRVSNSPETKRLAGELGCLPLLVRMLEAKTGPAREVAAQAIASLLGYQLNVREAKRDGKTVANLVQLLDPAPGNTARKYAVACLAALSASRRCRRLMVAHGAVGYLRKLAEMDVPAARKLLERLDKGRLKALFSRR